MVGRPDARWGEVPVAFVVLRPDAERDGGGADRVLPRPARRFKVPKAVAFIDELPRNPSGKVLKRVLREQAAAPEEGESR